MNRVRRRQLAALHSSPPCRRVLPAVLALGVAGLSLPPLAQASGPPQVAADWATNVTATSTNLHAQINPGGLDTTYRFEYLSEAAYQANLGASPPRDGFNGAAKAPTGTETNLGSASSDLETLQQVHGLAQNTTYRYRITATNSAEPAGVLGPAHTFTTEETSSTFELPDHRAWEMVSPIEKNEGAIQGFDANSGGGALQAAADGEAIAYSTASSFGQAQGAPSASQYLSRRSAPGWSTQNITVPLISGSYGDFRNGVPYQLFSTDLTVGLLSNGHRCRSPGVGCLVPNPPLPGTEAPTGYQDYYLRDDEDGAFTALLTDAGLAELALGPEQFELGFAGASPDLRHLILSTCAALTPEATEVPNGSGGCEAAETNLYEWSGGELNLINEPASHHAQLAAQAGAISSDGRRVYFTDGEDSPIFLHEEGQPTKLIEKTLGGAGSFQTASADGSLAFFTIGGDLYRYDALTETTSEPLATEVLGVLGASQDGSYLYYSTAVGVFLWHSGNVTKVASGSADPSDYPPTTGTARVTPDGTHLAFLSKAPLTGYDNTDQQSGEPDSEVYLYAAATNQLTCASCNPSGERPLGPSSIPGAIANGEGPTATDSYKPRDLSEDGTRLFFDSSDALVPQDSNAAPDVYGREAQGAGTCQAPNGCLNLISSGRSPEGASFVDASSDGSDVFFLTDASLVSSDPGSVDLYDAREGGGFPQPAAPIECEGDACQPLPAAPEDPTPGTLIPSSGNPPLHFPKNHRRKARSHHRHHHRRSHRQSAHRGG